MRSCERGTCSEGLSTKVLPVAMAYGKNQSGTMGGKLNGVIAANTPRGWRMVSLPMPVATSGRLCPIISVGMPAACSTFSMPRPKSLRDSDRVLPCSVVQMAAISSRCSSKRARSLKR